MNQADEILEIQDPAALRHTSTRQVRLTVAAVSIGMALALSACGQAPDQTGANAGADAAARIAAPAELREIIKEAYIYGFPMVDSYRIQYSYFVDPADPEYKGAWNEVHSVARVYTPQDTAIQTPNADTPYSFLGADLRAEPLVISVPAVPDRYYSLQLIDMYTHNFAYIGSRATGSDAGNFLLAGPGWQGEAPDGVDAVLRSETELAFVIYRTQLFGPEDLEAVERIQARFSVQPLSQFAGTTPPAPAEPIAFIRPLSAEAQRADPGFFTILSFLLQFTPAHPSETALLERFARAGIGPGKSFDFAALPPAQQQAVEGGIADAWSSFAEFKATEIDTGKMSSGDGFGTREFLGNDYMKRMAAAVLGIYGNSRDEADYPAYFVDSDGRPFDGASYRYTLRFEPGELPPAHSFWSLTMYELPSSLLVDNPIDRYLVNSTMEPDLVRDADGGITLYVQHESPGDEKAPNWLPAPEGPFFMVMRLYWPKPEASDGAWKAPPAARVSP